MCMINIAVYFVLVIHPLLYENKTEQLHCLISCARCSIDCTKVALSYHVLSLNVVFLEPC